MTEEEKALAKIRKNIRETAKSDGQIIVICRNKGETTLSILNSSDEEAIASLELMKHHVIWKHLKE